jgi:hypothetical protein
MKPQKITLIQSADEKIYSEMLRHSARANEQYCKINNIIYKQFIGIKRSYFSWHACFDRIIIIDEFLKENYRGWIFYLDADAYIHDLGYDVRSLLSDKIGIIAAPGGLTGEIWDINDGVFLLNLGSESGREIATLWHKDFMTTSDAELRSAKEWHRP